MIIFVNSSAIETLDCFERAGNDFAEVAGAGCADLCDAGVCRRREVRAADAREALFVGEASDRDLRERREL